MVSLLICGILAKALSPTSATIISCGSRFESGIVSRFVANECCFLSLNTKSGMGGAICITQNQSYFSANFTTFYNCSGPSAGAIYCMCTSISLLCLYGHSCYSADDSNSANFMKTQGGVCNATIHETSIFQCSSKSDPRGGSSIYSISENALLSKINSSLNAVSHGGDGLFCIQAGEGVLEYILIAFSSLNRGSSLTHLSLGMKNEIGMSSFVNNTMPKGGSGFLDVADGRLICENCVFSNNSDADIFYYSENSSVSVIGCIFSPSDRLGNLSLSSTGIIITMTVAPPIYMRFFDKCATPTASASVSPMPPTASNSSKKIAVIISTVLVCTIVLLGISIYAFYRLYYSIRLGSVRLKAFALTESIVSEFG